MSFTNKVVLITGASSGIGAATAVLFTKEGAHVAIVGRNEAKLKMVEQNCAKNGKKPLVIKADISNDDAAAAMVKKTVDTFGKLDVLVNNAGFTKFGTVLDGSIMETYDAIMAVNVRALIYITTLAVPHLIKTKGNIVNISSVAASSVPITPTMTTYCVSKAALNHFSRAVALELAPHGVRVNTVSPGPVKTDFLENAGASFNIEDVKTVLGRVSESEEVADVILFIASDKAVAITGSDYITDNGFLDAIDVMSESSDDENNEREEFETQYHQLVAEARSLLGARPSCSTEAARDGSVSGFEDACAGGLKSNCSIWSILYCFTMSFANKVVLITGASSGIGAATAVLFTKEGANVAIVGRNEAKLKIVEQNCAKNGKKPLVIKADISKDDAAAAMVKKTVDTFGKLDVLVNNAGFAKFGTVLDGNIMEAYDAIMAVNVRALIYITTLAVPHLIKTKGNIVNISSVAASSVPIMPIMTSYYVSKAALNHFSRAVALELAPHGVRVNTISPGPVKTDFLENAGASFDTEDVKTALGRVSESEEVADVILFIASDKAIAITGSDYITDNGFLLQH
ncbi:uncharacterized short-chain type dehydrogenase/reductase y4vI-like [Epargyreus clarus]|uniref:uncharacterized short-chain type dehydrogenase/reductase y4vI-like n=1 Tax=Epargyreus clarus TaxID=520877 RepID=UPI003C2C0A76